MPLPVSLRAVVQEMDVFSDEWHAYINKRTGELVTVSSEELRAAEEDAPLANFADWQHDAIRKAAEVLESADFLPLPSKFDIHEWSIMERFCFSVNVVIWPTVTYRVRRNMSAPTSNRANTCSLQAQSRPAGKLCRWAAVQSASIKIKKP